MNFFNDMSVGKIAGLVLGSLVAVILLAVVVIKVTSTPKVPAQVAAQSTKRPDQFKDAPDILNERLNSAQQQAARARADQQAIASALKQFEDGQQQQQQVLMNRLSAFEQRLANVEGSRNRVEVVKPPREVHPAPSVATRKTSLPQGYSLEATVSHRAFIRAGDQPDSLLAGESLPPVQYGPRIKSVTDGGVAIAH